MFRALRFRRRTGCPDITRNRTPANAMSVSTSIFPARTNFESPEPVVLHADLTVGGRRIRAREIRGTVRTEDGEVVGTVTHRYRITPKVLTTGSLPYTPSSNSAVPLLRWPPTVYAPMPAEPPVVCTFSPGITTIEFVMLR